MEIEIIDGEFSRVLYGLAGVAEERKYGEKGMELMNALWTEIEQRRLTHKGINHWVYYPGNEMFCAVELEEGPGEGSSLKAREISLGEHVRYVHVGPYDLLMETRASVHKEIAKRGLVAGLPALEIYGDWVEDPFRLETEILIPVSSL